jgi:hypothetical protein
MSLRWFSNKETINGAAPTAVHHTAGSDRVRPPSDPGKGGFSTVAKVTGGTDPGRLVRQVNEFGS